MYKLLGRAVGDVLTEFAGPRNGWNYGGTVTPVVDVRVIGTGTVKVQINSTPMFASTSNDPNPIDRTYIPNPANWSDVVGNIDQTSGLSAKNLTAADGRNWVRVVVVDPGAGDGKVSVGGRWPKRA